MKHQWHPAGDLARGGSAVCLTCGLSKRRQFNGWTAYAHPGHPYQPGRVPACLAPVAAPEPSAPPR